MHGPRLSKKRVLHLSPKLFPKKTLQICGILLDSFNKIAEQVILELIKDYMKTKLDSSQYATQNGIGIQHYLNKMLTRVLVAPDNNSRGKVKAVMATFVE